MKRGELSSAVAQLGAGDRSVGEAVFRALWPAMRRFCQVRVGAPGADDAAQRAMVKVFEQASDFDASRDALAWALELAHWECLTLRKAQARSKTQGLKAAGDTVSPSADALAALEEAELTRAVQEAVTQLSPVDQAEVAKLMLGELAGDAAARKRRQRALERLKALWRRLHGDA